RTSLHDVVSAGLQEVLRIRGPGMPASGEVTITGADPVLSARFRIGEAAAHVLAGVGVAVNDIHEMKTGRRQKIAVDVRHAAAACQSARLMRRRTPAGGWESPESPAMAYMRSLTRPWRTKDGRWYLPHFNLSH